MALRRFAWPTPRKFPWAHFEFTRINIEPTILHKKIEEFREAGATLLNAAAFIVTYAVSGEPVAGRFDPR
jgi:hypothetical protein